MLLSHLDKVYVYTIFKIICGGVKIRYPGLLQKNIEPNLFLANNTHNIFTQDLDE